MTDGISHLSFPSPIGPLTLFADGGAVVVVESGRAPDGDTVDPVLTETRRQIDAYFDGKLRIFDVPMRPHGTPRQIEIWTALSKIPYGATRSYGDIAREIASAPRAIGGACGANPLPILIPCHRVLAAGGAMGGYSFADGAETKRQLLCLEGIPL